VRAIWLGDNSSVTKRVVERLYACSSLLNEAGQHAYYGRVAGCLLTGNEDGVKHCAMNMLHLGAMLKRAGGIPAHGNQRSEWDAGCRFDFENPEHR
jgi:multimeric flavodoxin WrbA